MTAGYSPGTSTSSSVAWSSLRRRVRRRVRSKVTPEGDPIPQVRVTRGRARANAVKVSTPIGDMEMDMSGFAGALQGGANNNPAGTLPNSPRAPGARAATAQTSNTSDTALGGQ